MRNNGGESIAQKLNLYLLLIHLVQFEQPHQGGCITPSGNCAIWTPSLWRPVGDGRFSHAVVELDVVGTLFLTRILELYGGERRISAILL